MSITGMLFLFVFLPISLGLYYIVGNKVKEYVLLFISLVFYAIGSLKYLLLFIILTAITVLLGRIINKSSNTLNRKILLVLGIIINSGLLIYFKFADYLTVSVNNISDTQVQLNSIVLPLGISFFTFKAISYLVDVYKEVAVLSENPLHDALYLSFFAHISAGPITRYNDMVTVNEKDGKFSFDVFSNGVFRFLIGFNKKVVIADVLSKLSNEVFATPFDNFSLSLAWLGSICYSLELFFDFAGYSDMAIGISQMFGYKCMENFDYPYMTSSISKFWRRWHISLSQWFRDYIYIPLGGSRNKVKGRVYLNLLIVWLLTGLWHGSTLNFLVWGLVYFVFISFEKITGLPERFITPVEKAVYRVITLIIINIEWIIFRTPDMNTALAFIKRLFVCPKNQLASERAAFLFRDNRFFIISALILCFPIVPFLDKKLESNKLLHTVFEIIIAGIVIFTFLWALSYVVSGLNNPFAYANF